MTSQELSLFKELMKEVVRSTVKEVLKEELPVLMKKDLKEVKQLLAVIITESRNGGSVQPTFISKAENNVLKTEHVSGVDVSKIRSKLQEDKTYTFKSSDTRPIGTVDTMNGTLPDREVPFTIDMSSDIWKDIQSRE